MQLSKHCLNKAGIIPVHIDRDQMLCKVRQPITPQTVQMVHYLSQFYGKEVLLEYIDNKVFADELKMACFNDVSDVDHSVKPISKQLTQILQESFYQQASDVHFIPNAKGATIYIRRQGRLLRFKSVDQSTQKAFENLIKLKASLNTTDRLHPQNGQFQVFLPNDSMSCRVSTLPCLHGESFVVRLLSEKRTEADYQDGLLRTKFAAAFKGCGLGLWLISGPIGNGKTTSYYRLLKTLDHKRVLSLEDPIELPQPSLVQIKLSNETAQQLLRNVLRQAIDVVGIGEIRTPQQLKLAVNASITGHCTLATFHAGSVREVIQRLKNFGYAEDLQRTFLRGILFQSWTEVPPRTLSFTEKLFSELRGGFVF